jgi:hypothetical protein
MILAMHGLLTKTIVQVHHLQFLVLPPPPTQNVMAHLQTSCRLRRQFAAENFATCSNYSDVFIADFAKKGLQVIATRETRAQRNRLLLLILN